MVNDNKFLGTGWSFPPEFYNGGNTVKMVSGEEDIKQSIQIILTTELQERLMHSDFGSSLQNFVFESISQGLVSDIKSIISDAILNHEPRVKTESIELENIDPLKGLLHIHIAYKVSMTNNRFNYVFPFYLNETFN